MTPSTITSEPKEKELDASLSPSLKTQNQCIHIFPSTMAQKYLIT
jgi:hypothetical protein